MLSRLTVDQILLQYGNFLGYNITLRTLNPSIYKTVCTLNSEKTKQILNYSFDSFKINNGFLFYNLNAIVAHILANFAHRELRIHYPMLKLYICKLLFWQTSY